jgi:hypothetical protein
MFRHNRFIFSELAFITSPSILCYVSCYISVYVTWRGNEYELPEDEHDSVETCRECDNLQTNCNCALVGLFYRIKKKFNATCFDCFGLCAQSHHQEKLDNQTKPSI